MSNKVKFEIGGVEYVVENIVLGGDLEYALVGQAGNVFESLDRYDARSDLWPAIVEAVEKQG